MPLLPFLVAYLFLGLVVYVLVRLTDGPQGFGGLIGTILTGPIFLALPFVILAIYGPVAGIQWIGRRI